MRTIEVRRNALMKKLEIRTPDGLLRFALVACNGRSLLRSHPKIDSLGRARVMANGH